MLHNEDPRIMQRHCSLTCSTEAYQAMIQRFTVLHLRRSRLLNASSFDTSQAAAFPTQRARGDGHRRDGAARSVGGCHNQLQLQR